MESAKVGAFPEPDITQEGKFMCPICERSFYSRDFYENHIRNNHPQQAPTAQAGTATDEQTQNQRIKKAGATQK